jgi:elongator complex protein 3
MKCQCIRCREVGISCLRNGENPDLEQVELRRLDYEGSGGTDIFLSFEDSEHDLLVGYVRIRIPTEKAHRPEIAGQNTAIIRELHVFGQTVPVGDRLAGAFQHKGYGSRLLAEAERISREEYDRKKMLVISALGTKGYYSRFGYAHDGPYMSKNIV